jgi:outer membrane protein assembly factor BamA
VKIYFIFLFAFFLSITSVAQDTIQIENRILNGFKIVPLPILAVNPTNGWLFGVAPAATWYIGDKSNTAISSLLASAIYTTNNQLMFTAKAGTYFSANKWTMITDIRFFISSQPTYGIGSGPQSAKPVGTGYADYSDNPYKAISTSQMMEFSFFRLHNALMKRIPETHLFAGLGYHLDIHYKIYDHLLNLDTVPQIATSHYMYSDLYGYNPEKYCLSGISLNLLYDSRDNSVNPYSGRYAYANIRLNPVFLGSDKRSSILWLEYRDYIHLSNSRPRHLIGLWTYGWFVTSGDVPYMDLPAVGWDQFGRSGRAYTQGRIRGLNLIYSELEYRVPLQRKKDTFGAVVFVNNTTATNPVAEISLFEYNDIAYGAGLRIMVNKKTRSNLAIDYAIGKYGSQGFYFGINEVF